MADIGDIAVALAMDHGLVGAALLQVIVADEAHVLGLRRIADLRRLRRGGSGGGGGHEAGENDGRTQ